MQTIHATWKDGVFTPAVPVDLAEGVEVEIRIVAAKSAMESTNSSQLYPRLDPPFESECRPAPFELPMPTHGELVKTCDQDELLPEPHDLAD